MNEYILIHRKSEKKITLGYSNVWCTLRSVEFSEGKWDLEELTVALRYAHKYRNETDILETVSVKGDAEFEFISKPRDLRFEIFWNTYSYKVGKIPTAQKAWGKLSDGEKIEALLYISKLKDKKKIEGTALPYPSTYLNGKYWLADKL